MGMRINAELPLPADLKAEYPLSDKIIKIKEKRDAEIRDIFTGKSGLHRAGCRITSGRGDSKESATEINRICIYICKGGKAV